MDEAGALHPSARPAKLRRARDPDRVRRIILDAALTSFAADGYEGCSVRGIAQQAGISLSLVLYHFQTKETLWRAAVEDMVARKSMATLVLEEARPDRTAAEKVRAAIPRIVRAFADCPALYRVLELEGHEASARLTWLCETLIREDYAVMSEILAQGQRDGDIRALDVKMLRYAIYTLAAMPFSMPPMFEYLTGRSGDDERSIRGTIEVVNALVFVDPASRAQSREIGAPVQDC